MFLDHLYLGPNSLESTIPEVLYQLPHLTHLYINDCILTGYLSSTIGGMIELRESKSIAFQFFVLNLSLCFLMFFAISNHAEGLGLHNNLISGSIPTELGGMESIRE